MSSKPEPIATAEELRAATELFVAKREGMTRDEKEAAWLEWLEKRAVRLLKDAAALGKWGVVLDAPYQPTNDEERAALKRFGRKVKPFFPGCTMWVNEEEVEEEGGQPSYTIELSWTRVAAARATPALGEDVGNPGS